MELPAPDTNEQAGPAPVAGQGERIPDLETRDETRTPNQETIVTENIHRPVERPPPTPHQIEQLRQKADLGERLGDRLNMLTMSVIHYSQEQTNQKAEEKAVITLEEL